MEGWIEGGRMWSDRGRGEKHRRRNVRLWPLSPADTEGLSPPSAHGWVEGLKGGWGQKMRKKRENGY